MIVSLLRHAAAAVGYACAGALVLALVLLVGYLHGDPTPQWWHTTSLDGEYTAASASEIVSIEDYRALEDRLYEQIRREEQAHHAGPADFQRYVAGSRSDPTSWPEGDWNRTQELVPADPRGAALLLHGVSDSPYSMRALALSLYASGIAVVVLRLPGHGTLPSAMLTYRLADMRAAVRMAAMDLSSRVAPGKPLWLVGYSNGAALCVDYALDVVQGARLPQPAGLVLLSPAIGIAPAARIVQFRHVFGWVPGLSKLAWTEIAPEYDPFKYSSFSFNAIEQTSELTRSIQRRTSLLARTQRLVGFPPTLAFLSTVDATVSADAVVDQFMGRLSQGRHALVLFDVNRSAEASHLLRGDPGPLTRRLLGTRDLPFELTIVGNASADASAVDATVLPTAGEAFRVPLCLEWPSGVFSLSHLALPFAPDDKLYGYTAAPDTRVVQLGRIEARGETGVLALPRWLSVRQRSNPFFGYLAQRVLAFTGATASKSACDLRAP